MENSNLEIVQLESWESPSLIPLKISKMMNVIQEEEEKLLLPEFQKFAESWFFKLIKVHVDEHCAGLRMLPYRISILYGQTDHKTSTGSDWIIAYTVYYLNDVHWVPVKFEINLMGEGLIRNHVSEILLSYLYIETITSCYEDDYDD